MFRSYMKISEDMNISQQENAKDRMNDLSRFLYTADELSGKDGFIKHRGEWDDVGV